MNKTPIICSVNKGMAGRIGISFTTDDSQITVFLNHKEFLTLLGKMLDYRDEYRTEFERAIQCPS